MEGMARRFWGSGTRRRYNATMSRRLEWIESHLNDLKAEFSFRLGVSFADPDHPGLNRNLRLMFEDNLDNLTAT